MINLKLLNKDVINLKLFNKDDWSIRVAERDGEPWFVATDVCKALDIRNVPRAIEERVCSYEKENVVLNDGAQGSLTFISLSGLYSLVWGSENPEAEDFRIWIDYDVSPSPPYHFKG